MTASVRMVLSQATDLISEEHTVFTADVQTAFLNAHMMDGNVVFARPPPEWQLETQVCTVCEAYSTWTI